MLSEQTRSRVLLILSNEGYSRFEPCRTCINPKQYHTFEETRIPIIYVTEYITTGSIATTMRYDAVLQLLLNIDHGSRPLLTTSSHLLCMDVAPASLLLF